MPRYPEVFVPFLLRCQRRAISSGERRAEGGIKRVIWKVVFVAEILGKDYSSEGGLLTD